MANSSVARARHADAGIAIAMDRRRNAAIAAEVAPGVNYFPVTVQ